MTPGPLLRALLALSLCVGAAATTQAAEPRVHALLIGASTYVNLPPDKSLRAPANDVRRMHAALLARGVPADAIALYADGVEGSRADPTAAAILAAFTALPGRVADGDQVVIYMSGHGTQIPDDDGDEDDGFDEAFLPVDAVPPRPGSTRFDMTNVIRDDRIGGLIDALRRKGAHVFLVVDSCHSGTISRAATEESRAKELNAADFGLPANGAPAGAATALGDTKRNTATTGSLVAFYASQANEISLELAVPRGAPPAQQSWVSAFTDALVGTLQHGGATTYRDLLSEAARAMRAQIPPRTRQTPSFDGDALDQPLLGGGAAAQPAGYAVTGDRVAGGLIAGLEPGTVLALYARAGADTPIGHAQVLQADALTAQITAVTFPCVQRQGTPTCERADAGMLAQARFARAAVPVTRLTLRISTPRDWPGRDAPPERSDVETQALALIRANPAYVVDDARPDFIWYRTPDGMRFVPSWVPASDEEFGPAATLDGVAPGEAAERIAAALDRAHLLMRLERVRAALPSNGLPIGVATAKTMLVRYERDGDGRCRFRGSRATLAATDPVHVCDGAVVQLRNGGSTAVFAYAFALDDSWVLHPLGNSCRQGAQNRVDIGGARSIELQYRNGSISPGLSSRTRNGVVVFAVPFEPGIGLPFDPCQVVRQTTAGNRTRSTGSDGDPIDAILSARDGTRSSGGNATARQLVMAVETWVVDQGRR